MKKKSPIDIEAPTKTSKYVDGIDKMDAENDDGDPIASVGPKGGKKKSKSIVAIRHGRVLNRVLSGAKNVGKHRKRVSLYQAMNDEGFSHEYAKSGGIKKSKNWDRLIEERLHDDKLSNIHSQLLTAKKLDYMLFTSEIPDEDIYLLLESVNCTPKKIVHGVQGTHVWFWSLDNKTRKDSLDLAYKVRGKMAPERFEIENGGLSSLTDEELALRIKQLKARFTKTD